MSNPWFKFKQFTIWHDQCAMRVNTDGVLLGAWATINNPGLILDVGAGTGLISLMLAQRSNALIHALEIEENACKQIRFNAEQSIWSNRIIAIHNNFCNYYKSSPRYDLVVSNPPYFSNSLKNADKSKSLARHNDSLPVKELLKGVASLLTNDGIFAVILPENTTEFEEEAFINGLTCTRLTIIRSLPDKNILRKMMEFTKCKNLRSVSTQELSIYRKPGIYSSEYIQLTSDFYLNF